MHVCGSTWRKALQTQENMQTPDRKAPDWIWTKEVTVLTTAPAWRPPERSFIDKVSPCELASLNTVKSCTHCVSLGCPRQKTTKNHDDIFSITVKAVQIGQIWWSLQPKFPPCHRVWLCVCRFDAEKGKSSCVGVAKVGGVTAVCCSPSFTALNLMSYHSISMPLDCNKTNIYCWTCTVVTWTWILLETILTESTSYVRGGQFLTCMSKYGEINRSLHVNVQNGVPVKSQSGNTFSGVHLIK